jgi:integrase
MGKKKTPGLSKRYGIWQIDKVIHGRRLCESTGSSDLEDAERYLAKRTREIADIVLFGSRPERIWREAATKFINDNLHRTRIDEIARHLKQLDPYIGNLPLDQVHMETLRPFINDRKKQGRRAKTINIALGIVRRILNLCAQMWRDDTGQTWLAQSPYIEMLTVNDSKAPYPLDWAEQGKLLKQLPPHLARMALYKVNSGCREAEVCGLRWEWEIDIPDFDPIIFLIPAGVTLTKARGSQVKNRHDRIVVCDDVACDVVNSMRGQHDTHVFIYKGQPLPMMHNSAWKRAWKDAGLPTGDDYLKGPHNLKHTFGRRLRAVGVPKDTRQVLLGHRSGDVTDHYSVPEIQVLYDATNRVLGSQTRESPVLHMVKRKAATAIAAN